VLKKNFSVLDVKRAVSIAKKAGLEVDGMFMIGLPGESRQDIERSVDFSIELNLRYAIMNIFVPYPGCELYDILTKENKISYRNLSDFTSYPTYSGGKPVYVPDGFTHQEIMSLQRQAMKKFYLRPGFFLGELQRFRPRHIKKYWKGLKAVISK